MKNFTIGEIAQKLEISVSAVRYYDEVGLLPFVQRNQLGQRVFSENDLGYIEVICCLKKAAIPIKEIAKFMEWCVEGDSTLTERYQFMIE